MAPIPCPLPRAASHLLRHAALGLLAAASLATATGSGAHAAPADGERRIRLSLQIEQQREAGIAVIGGSGRQNLNQRLDYAVTLVSQGGPAVNNPLDPEDGAR